MKIFLRNLRYDLPASIVVFFIALPLCLGIALASGAPLFSGIISGIIGGVVVGAASGSRFGVSGPAAGLAIIILSYVSSLGSWESVLLATMLAGAIQLMMGYLRLGTIAYYFPSSVIKGMLSGIGLTIIIKQIPHALGYDVGNIGDFEESLTLSDAFYLQELASNFTPAAIAITMTSMILLIVWDEVLIKKHKIFKIFPAPLAIVLTGIVMSNFLELANHQIVQLPIAKNASDFFSYFMLPNFEQLRNPEIYLAAIVIAAVASVETLLCVEATDKLDPQKRLTPTNRELKAQGLGNIISGLIGGLPITQVIVRSSANISFGAKTKSSAIIHGLLLLASAVTIPTLLNMIPLSSLACILIIVGYKLSNPSIFKKIYKLGFEQFLPFISTVVAMIYFDLLKGVALGMVVAIYFILYRNFCNAFERIHDEEGKHHEHILRLAEEVSFLNKGAILQMLDAIPAHSKVLIDGSKSKVIDYDIVEIIHDFHANAKSKNIDLTVRGVSLKKI